MKVHWHMTPRTHMRMVELHGQMQAALHETDLVRYQELAEEFQQLEGFPSNLDEDHDVVVPVVHDTEAQLRAALN